MQATHHARLQARGHGPDTLPTLRGTSEPGASVVAVAGRCHAGNLREQNDDHFMAVDVQRSLAIRTSSLEPESNPIVSGGTVLMVADGMGGYGDGALASAVVVDDVVSYLAQVMPGVREGTPIEDLAQGLQGAVAACQERLRAVAERRSADPRLGTTLTVVTVFRGCLFVAHVGDSRAYIFREGYGLYRLTHDHTLGELLRARGISGDEQHHVLTQAVGANRETPEIERLYDRVQPGDRLLLCTDGVSNEMSDQRLAAWMASKLDPDATAEAIATEILSGEARDNLTVLVADIG